uniref:Cell division control protein 73 C-terminal domain-containing protein n=1 Tax=Neobodo designis TaxID=312471 RepID=A0A7S1PYU1_NEODS|mmetsp:Transcript_25868/g.79864  ORF Transcript_25868/g.79864 Transcript_25868/m.79864 type:complete len:302 (+) Transcript_25868:149-1054(+)|eukprot:CAMPEP_0174853878 /NCGR_PEP_ID=MMETSP1114-20130205/29616_1 /TAXON_ID=312471 /ORGANISM="Neobodo designis, Strain CCAP 1951/1" /LENGTH=301 /DNA_ID=CAMNT_0016088545 /DNA_START=145 /DNA_END=1050 /DNA_ORIENTATION=-
MATAEWEAMVDAVANGTEDEGLASVLANYNPTVPEAVLAESRERFADKPYVPLLSEADVYHARPAKAHQTDVFVTHERHDDPDFRRLVRQIANADDAVVPPEAPTFDPIILVSDAATAVVQKCNVQRFLEEGEFRPVEVLRAAGDELATSLVQSREAEVYVTPRHFTGLQHIRVTFRRFRVVNDPKLVSNWDHVCACFVTGHEWQFDGWYHKKHVDPAVLFANVRGYYPFFEESKLPPIIKQWRVQPLLLTHKETKQHSSVRVAAQFWEDLYTFLDSHPYFRRYSLWPVAGGKGRGLPSQV